MSTETRRQWTLFATGLAALAGLCRLASRYPYFEWDLSLLLLIQEPDAVIWRSWMFLVSAIGTGWIPFIWVPVAGLLFYRASLRWEAICCTATVAAGALVNRVIKLLVERPRPPGDLVEVLVQYPNHSFPSGHVVLFVQFFGLLFFFSRRIENKMARTAARAALGWMILSVGVSRVYLGAHWPSDVLGGYLAGTLWLFCSWKLFSIVKPFESPS